MGVRVNQGVLRRGVKERGSNVWCFAVMVFVVRWA